MSRILEYQPSDEHTVVARVLLELHQAIDAQFPQVAQSARQFSKTVLTHQSEATSVENKPHPNNRAADRVEGATLAVAAAPARKSASVKERNLADAFRTADMATLLGESRFSRFVTLSLVVALLAGLSVFAWLVIRG